MPIDFTCKCGKQLRARDDQAGKRIQCPACGRALVAPQPAEQAEEQARESDWTIDNSPIAATRAQRAGVVARGRASVVLLQSADDLDHDLAAQGKITCWHCKHEMPFTARVFGRVGLGGTALQTTCRKCHAKLWMGYSSHRTGKGTEVYLYVPHHTRELAVGDDEPLPPSNFQAERVTEGADPDARQAADEVNTLLPAFVKAVSNKQPYQEVSELAARLVGQPLSASQMEGIGRSLRALLEREESPYLIAILMEALACLRDERAGQVVQATVRNVLDAHDPADPSDLPVHDVCVMALLFGDGNGFLEAMKHGLRSVRTETKACRLGKPLTPQAVAKLVEEGANIDSYESTLGGNAWQQVLPLLPLWVDEDEPKKKAGWLNRLFGK